MKVTLRKVLLLALFVLVLTALFVVGASAATLDGTENAAITDDASAIAKGAVARIGDAGGAYYTTVANAVTAASDGGTVTLIADHTVTATITIGKNVTIDGNGKLVTTAVGLFVINGNYTVEFKNLKVVSTGTGDGRIVSVNKVSATVKITGCQFYCDGDVIFLRPYGGSTTIQNSTLVSGADLIQVNDTVANYAINITNSNLYTADRLFHYYKGSGAIVNITGSKVSFASANGSILYRRGTPWKFTLSGNTVIGGALTVTRPDTGEVTYPACERTELKITGGEVLTLNGNVQFFSGTQAAFTVDASSTVNFSTDADTAYSGKPIIRKKDDNYHLFDNVSDSLNGASPSDEIFTYSSTTAATINSTPGYAVTEADGKYSISLVFAMLNGVLDETITDDASAVAKGAVARIGDEGVAYFTTVPGAVAVVASGDTITLIADIGSETEPLQLTGVWIDIPKTNITLDGNGHTIIATSTASGYNGCMIKARDYAGNFCLKNLTIHLTYSDSAANDSPVLFIGVVKITVEDCNFYTNRMGIYARQQRADVTVTNTNIYAGYYAYESFDTRDTSFTLTFTNCVLQSETVPAIDARIDNNLILDGTTVRGGNGTDITLTSADPNQSTAVTIKGNTNFTNGNIAIALTEGTDSITFDTSYTGTQIFRKSSGNYYAYNNIDNAFADVADGDEIFTYSSTVAASINNIPGYAAIEGADGKYSIIAAPTLDGVTAVDITDDASAIAKGAVARIGTAKVAYFTTLSGAVAAATDGGTVTLLANVALTEAVTVDKSITLDNNSYTVTATGVAFTLSGASTMLTVDASVLSADKISGKVAKIEKENTVTYFTDVATAVGTMPLTDATVTVTLLADIGTPGNPLTLSDTWFVMPGDKNHNNLTLDGNGHTVIAVLTENKDFISARDRASFTLKNLTLDLTFPENSGNAILNTGGITAITIENCYLDSTGMGISAWYQRGNVTVTETEIRTAQKVYKSSDTSAADYTVITTFTNSTLISTNETAIISGIDDKMIFNGTTVHGGNGTDATFSADYATIVEINGNTQFVGGNISITVPNEIQFNTDAEAPYSGGQIIRMNTRNYYFYNVATDAVADFANGDKIFTYSSDAAVAISKAGFSVVEAEGVYTATERLDFTAIDGAINIANTAKQGASVAEKPCDVGAGKGYVLAADAQALEAAIIAAQTAKNSAMNNQQLAEAVATLSEAVAAFQAKIEEGKDHEAAEGAAACSTTCKYCNKVGVVSATDEHTVAIPCSDYQCSECGETVKPVDHERKYECSKLCKYCDAELFSNEEPHTREAACLKICKYCGEEKFEDAAEHEQKAACSGICKICGTEQFPGTGEHERKSLCSNICKHCETEQFDDAVVCVGLVPCTDAICQYCGEAVTPVPHEGEVACDVTCKYCGEDVVTPVPHEGELPCDTTCKYCHVENAVTNAAAHDGEFACSTTCKYGCGTEITDAVECVGEVLCTSTTCKYCGEAVVPVPHSGLHACSTSCQYCGVAVTPTAAHSFNYACDTNCKVCSEAIDHVAHTGAVPCAASCKYCGKGIVPGNHEGEYKCATVCQWCGVEVEPTKDHVKEHSCDLVCLMCQEETEQVHEYDNDCDANCNGCGLARNTAHKYDNDCDAECNVCKLTREITHTYKNKRDHTCELCGFDNAPKEEEGEGEKKEGLELWMIIAIAAGAVVVIAAVVVTIVIVKKKKKKATKDPGAEDASKEEPKKAKKEKAKKDSKKKAEKKPEEKKPEEKPEEKAEEKAEEAPEAKTEESSEEK